MRCLSTVVLVLAVAVLASVPASALTINWDAPRKPLADVTVEDRAGDPVDLDAFAGRIVVLNLWATWCAPCKREMPTLARLQAAFAKGELEVVALAVDRAPFAELDAFMAEAQASDLTVLRSADMEAARALAAPGLPVTLVIDRVGFERFRHAGFADWGSPEVIAALRELVDE